MKKTKLLYILTIIITLFTFNMDVNAEPNFEIKSYEGKTSLITCQGFARLTKEMGLDSAALEKLDTTKYDLTCTYGLEVSDSTHVTNNYLGGEWDVTTWGCHVIQFSVNRNGNVRVAHSFPGSVNNYNIDATANEIKNAIEQNGGMCPSKIYASVSTEHNSQTSDDTSGGGGPGCYHNGNCSDNGTTSSGAEIVDKTVTVSLNAGGAEHTLSSASGYNWVTGQNFKFDKWAKLIGSKIDILDCEHLFTGVEGEDLKEIIKWVIQIMKIAIPILLIGLGIMDFVKAVFSGKEDDMKKAQEKFIKRIIIGVCIFLIPTLITYILKLYNLVWDKNINTDFCGILN